MPSFVRSYRLTSLACIAAAGLLLGWVYRSLAVNQLIDHATRHVCELAELYSNALREDLIGLDARARGLDAAALGALPEVARLRARTTELMRGTEVVKVKLYALDGRTLFSTEARQIGEDKSANAGFLSARAGTPASELTYRDRFSAFDREIVDRNVISAYVPITDTARGKPALVLELYEDVTPVFAAISRAQAIVFVAVITVLAALFLILQFMVRRMDRAIQAQVAAVQAGSSALKREEARLRDFARASNDWFAECDADLRLTWISDELKKFPWLQVERLYGKRYVDLRLPGDSLDAEPWKSHMKAVARREPFRDFRFRIGTPAGTRCMSLSGVPVLSEDGRFMGYRGVGLDVTDEEALERRLAEADTRLRNAIDSLSEGFVLWDAEGRLLLSNQRAQKLNERVCEQFLPGTPYETYLRAAVAAGLMPQAIGNEEAWIRQRLALRAKLGPEPIEIQRQYGQWLLVSEKRMPDGTVTSVAVDITRQKRAEQALAELNATLEARVAERTRAHAGAMAEMESLSYAISHDLRAPLRAINGFAGTLQAQETERLSEEGRKLLERITERTADMARQIADLLELLRVIGIGMQRKSVDMGALARDVVATLSPAWPGACITVDDLPTVQGDPTLLRRALANLVDNALKYSSRTTQAKVEIGARAGEAETEYFVRDNGAGFDMQFAHKLFGAFQRLHTPREFPGTGIGLAIVQRVVLRHGGRVFARGSVGGGAEFGFALPT